MDGIQSPGPQLTENGTFMPTEELLDGQQPGALMALVINKTLAKQQEFASTFRTDVMNDLGKGLRLDSSV